MIDPCGLAVDIVRSCYSTQMRFSCDGPSTTVRWYFVPPGTPFVKGPHLYCSGNWEWQKDYWPGHGEVAGAPRPWENGSPPPGLGKGPACGFPIGWRPQACDVL